MIVSEGLPDKLMYVVEGLILVIAIVWRFYPPKRWWGHVLMLVAMAVCFRGGFAVADLGSRIVLVKIPKPGGGPTVKTRGTLLFAESYTMQNGSTVRITPAELHTDCVIVNDSDKTLRMETSQYTNNPALANGTGSPETIAPFAIRNDAPQIEAIGPDEELPNMTEAYLQETYLFHLNWDE